MVINIVPQFLLVLHTAPKFYGYKHELLLSNKNYNVHTCFSSKLFPTFYHYRRCCCASKSLLLLCGFAQFLSLGTFFKELLLFMGIYNWEWMPHVCPCPQKPEKALNAPELESQTVAILPIWKFETEPWSSATAASTLHYRVITPALDMVLIT